MISILGFFFHAKAVEYGTTGWVYSYFIDRLLGRYDESMLNNVDHVMFVVTDHYEPGTSESDTETSIRWLQEFRENVIDIYDSYGNKFQYTWFYPYEHRNYQVMEQLNRMVKDGFGEIEFHWHHRHASSASFENDLDEATRWFRQFGAMVDSTDGEFKFSFIHGNWALDNSAAGGAHHGEKARVGQLIDQRIDLPFSPEKQVPFCFLEGPQPRKGIDPDGCFCCAHRGAV